MVRSPLHELHSERGAKFVDFGGWEMPLQYESVLAEHQRVRTRCGWFDVSHLGRFWIDGPKAVSTLQRLCTNSVETLEPGHTQYTLILNETGGVVDDMVIWRFPEGFLVAPNAANHQRVLKTFADAGSNPVDLQSSTASVAIQGPLAPDIIEELLGFRAPRFHTTVTEWRGHPIRVATTGYTGELGGEVVLDPAIASRLVLEVENLGGAPCGLGARDTLRLEAALPLWGHEMNDHITPLEAGLGFAVDFGHDFVGREALEQMKKDGIPQRLVKFKMPDRQPPRHGQTLLAGPLEGFVTSGNFSPLLSRGIGFGYLPSGFEGPVHIRVRDSLKPVELCEKSFLHS